MESLSSSSNPFRIKIVLALGEQVHTE